MPIHNEAKPGEIAKTVLMPGDPMRAKYIAENFLEDCKLVNRVRGMFAYTGKYKGKEITVMASGMGMPSMAIYACELFKFYDVENIIRLGSCGALSKDLKLLDLIIVDSSYSNTNLSMHMDGTNTHVVNASTEITNIIEKSANELNLKYARGNTNCSEYFTPYMENQKEFLNSLPQDFNAISTEMESFALLYLAKFYNKKAGCILTVSDSIYFDEILTPEQREKSVTDMIKLALESGIKI